ncbi:MAG: DNA polymerase I [Firmicutes bacterium]|nr:DNA polymerase I [Bacillota bacterium]
MNRIAIIDGNSLINRAYYARRNPLMTKEGIYTHAIFGFVNMLEKIRKTYEPTHMAVAFDMKAPTFRHLEYGEYKAGRKKMPPELAMQIPLLKELLDAMGITRIEIEGFEADDIIGTIARAAEDEGLEPYIITGDKDQLQLVTDVTKVVFTKKGVSEFDLYDEDFFREKYGFEPIQFIDYKGLAGDSSDNIPGVPGVGDKSATKLIQEFGGVEEILAHADEIKPAGLQKKIKDNRQQALMSKMLATINTTVPIDTDPAGWIIRPVDTAALIALYRKLEFNRFLRKLKVDGGAPGLVDGGAETSGSTEVELVDGASFEKVIVRDGGALKELDLSGDVVLKVFGDNSHVRRPVIDGIILTTADTCYYFDPQLAGEFASWLQDQPLHIAGHDIKKDLYMLMCLGASRFHVAFDTQVAEYVLDPGRSDYSMSAMSTEFLQATVEDEKEFLSQNAQMDLLSDPADKMLDYGLRWCLAVINLRRVQEPRIAAAELDGVLYDIELPLIEVMAGMEKEGFRADREFLAQFGQSLSGEIDRLTGEIHEMAGEEFNINSPTQLGPILFEKLDLPHGKKTKRGYSTSADILEKVRDKHPIVPAILEYRQLTKLKSTYVDGLIPLINEEDGKIHAHFMQTVAATGRISCIEPNLQNIPIRTELGRQLRKAFVPDDEGHTLVGADYSQIELRVLAHMSEDPVLIEAFNNGEDIHRATAANVLGIPEDQITAEERSRAKAVNFGVIYGMSGFGLSSNLNISRREADEYIKAYFDKHQAVKAFMDGQVEFCKSNGYVETMFGRKRYINEIKASQFMVRQVGERLAMNSPIQGSAADIIKIAMIRVYRGLREAGLKSRLILQIHDELIIHTEASELEEVKKLLVENMESAVTMNVALKADLNEGGNWYELK